MRHNDIDLNAQETSTFTDDLTEPEGLLHVYPVVSEVAHGKIEHIDMQKALVCPGVHNILLARDIPGINNIGNVETNEVLLAEEEVVYQGQPIALVIADSDVIARQSAKLVSVKYHELPADFDAHTAHQYGLHIAPPRIFSLGNVDKAWQDCTVIVEGSVLFGAQEHVYLETQVAIAYPLENNGLRVVSATQSPGMVQRMIARVLGCPMYQIEVDVLRLGGGFGGKEEQATDYAAMAALAANQLQKPVKLIPSRNEDIRLTGKRHPYDSDFKMGLDQTGKILAYEVCFYQNAGAVADLSLAILERSLFHAGNSYFIPNVRATAISCRTNLPPNTAFRGFGAPQAMFVLESAIFKAASALNIDPAHIQQTNLLQEGQHFPYGMLTERCRAQHCWQQLQTRQRQQAIEAFNASHSLAKTILMVIADETHLCFLGN